MYSGLTARLSTFTKSVVSEKDVEIDTTIGYISNWSVEETRDIIEVTQLHSMTKKKMPSLYSWSASADGTVDFADGGQIALRTAMMGKEPINVKFYLNFDGSAAAKHTALVGKAFVESMSIDISAEDKGNISISLSGDERLTLTTSGIAETNITSEWPNAK